MIPIGTRIQFTKQLECGPTEDHPAFLYASIGETGVVVGHDASEGYEVKTDSWPLRFGASDDEFVVVEAAKGGE